MRMISRFAYAASDVYASIVACRFSKPPACCRWRNKLGGRWPRSTATACRCLRRNRRQRLRPPWPATVSSSVALTNTGCSCAIGLHDSPHGGEPRRVDAHAIAGRHDDAAIDRVVMADRVFLFEALDRPIGLHAGGRTEVAAVAQVFVARPNQRTVRIGDIAAARHACSRARHASDVSAGSSVRDDAADGVSTGAFGARLPRARIRQRFIRREMRSSHRRAARAQDDRRHRHKHAPPPDRQMLRR